MSIDVAGKKAAIARLEEKNRLARERGREERAVAGSAKLAQEEYARAAVVAREAERRPAGGPSVTLTWNEPQTRFLLTRGVVGGPIEFLDIEGGVRSGKSSVAAVKLCEYARLYPGIQMAACRWSQDALDAQVRPLWRDWAKRLGLVLRWHADEEYDEIVGTGSRVYLRALKASDDASRYAKLAGMTLGVLWIDQPEEVPKDVAEAYVPARLSQPKYPHEAWYTPNPPGQSHWLTEMFPEKNAAAHHHYFRTSVYDNRANLGEAYILDLETAYPVGTALRRRFVDGRRGLAAVGEPVYQGYFSRKLHESELAVINPEVPVCESWDFGHHHPAVAWLQFLPQGRVQILGGVMGESLFLEDFVPEVLKIRGEWCQGAMEFKTTGDPAGTMMSSQGVNKSAADVLRAHGIHIHVNKGANHPQARNAAIQSIAGYLRRMTPQGPAFQINPRCLIVGKGYQRYSPEIADGLEAGYVWSDDYDKNTRKPKKDGWYDHFGNVLEYAFLKFGPAAGQVSESVGQTPEHQAESIPCQPGAWMS